MWTYYYIYIGERKGFSLIELMVIVTILAIAAGIAFPSFLEMVPLYRANSDIKDLAFKMRLARMNAISDANNYFISFNANNQTYQIVDDNNNNKILDAGEATLGPFTLSTGIQFGANNVNDINGAPINQGLNGLYTGGDNIIVFNSDGSAEDAAIYIMPTKDFFNPGPARNDRMRVVSLMKVTGNIRIWKYNTTLNNWVQEG